MLSCMQIYYSLRISEDEELSMPECGVTINKYNTGGSGGTSTPTDEEEEEVVEEENNDPEEEVQGDIGQEEEVVEDDSNTREEDDEIQELLMKCMLTDTRNFMNFYENLVCHEYLNPVRGCTDARCYETATREDVIRLAIAIRGVEVQDTCEGLFPDVDEDFCPIAETAASLGIISSERDHVSPDRPATRPEALSILMGAVCFDYASVDVGDMATVSMNQWHRRVVKAGIVYGFTNRGPYAFSQDRSVYRSEVFVFGARVVDWSQSNGGCMLSN